jgi:PmbA protein
MRQSNAAETDALSLLEDVLARAKRAGAEMADAVLFQGVSQSASIRLGKPENLERAENRDLGLRVMQGRKQAFVSTTDLSANAVDAVIERAIAMARAAPEDKYCGLADAALLARAWPDLDLSDAGEPSPQEILGLATEAEAAALAVKGVSNSEGAEAGSSRGLFALATSHGFAGAYTGTRCNVFVSAVAGNGDGMERDYDFSSAHHRADLADPAELGRKAGQQAVRRLKPRKVSSQAAPVVFDPRVAGSFLGHLSGAISGSAVARGTSFLKDKMGEEIFPSSVTVVDDPHRLRGLRSHPFDGEGVACKKRNIIDQGRLTTWLLESASARQLGLATTGHASRGAASPPGPSPSNLYLEPGAVSPKDMIGGIKQGLYVMELIGMGVNGVTGDYSRGASGFWIESGELTYPVSELTIAGNLKDMFRRITAGNDLTFKYGIDSPTLLIEGMTVAGR